MLKNMTLGKVIGLILLLIFIVLQFFQINRNNPSVTQKMPAPDNVQSILEESCYDCHSNQTDWPWYSYVAPVSWFIGNDVHEAREYLNMSEWDSYNQDDRAHAYEEIVEVIEHEAMPLPSYEFIHGEAELTEEEEETLLQWAESQLESAEGQASDGHEGHDH